MAKRRICACARQFTPNTANHRACPRCSKAHRLGRRCEVASCARCVRSFARLDAFNARRDAHIVCGGCGIGYGAFRSGYSFADVRRMFITDEPNRKTGKRLHGRRHGVLGKMRELKKLNWRAHVDECESAKKGAA